MTLIEFLTARYDEEEQDAQTATPGPWAPSGHSVLDSDGIEFVEATRRDVSHIARHDPARVLREINAKRAVLDLHTWAASLDGCWSCSGDHGADPTPAPCDTLRHMAAVYAGHPDYQQKWSQRHGASPRGGIVVPRDHGDDIPVMLSPGCPAEEIVEHYGEDLALRLNERSPHA